MRFAMLSIAASAALALCAGPASAQWGHHHRHHGHGHRHVHGHSYGGGHLDYHNGHFHYHNGYYRSGPLYPAYPSYWYGPGASLQFGGLGLSVGSGYYSPSWGDRSYGGYPWW